MKCYLGCPSNDKDLNPMSAAGDTYLNPTPGPSSLTEIVSDCVRLEYNVKLGRIIDFEDLGTTCRQSLADHALVLMIKTIKSKYKQPISYTFCMGSTKAPDLKEIKKHFKIGLKETTICDQAATNTKVVKMLQGKIFKSWNTSLVLLK
ncbi:hypothetical protein HF086_004642 [Spodoptera exigua]|uniref:Transposable element P transposase-like RNase H domain-containing protein n=1 Tax=Spodoptera exigua TaxID=7107 RepID=A0A922M7J8_SPOEX|nr:hypothetical protein HF086_004642 [Spodoptera exigua]